MRKKLGRLVLAAGIILYVAASAAPEEGFAIAIKPLSTGGRVHALEVHQRITAGLPAGEAPLIFRAPRAIFGVAAIADKIVDLSVTDAVGAVPLRRDDATQAKAGELANSYWHTVRQPILPVSLSYRIDTQPDTEQGGPPFGMRGSGQGVSGLGLGFLLLPENITSTATRLDWDLSELPPGSVGVITAGAGSTVVAGAPQALLSQWILAGPAAVFHSARTPGFHIYVLGRPPFDVAATIDWADRAYAYLGKSLQYLGSPEYRLFIRALDVPAYATGSARPAGGGALLTTGDTLGAQTMSEFKNTLFHEMTHQWVGDQSGAGAWFVEGLTTYLSAVLPCVAGLEAPEFCADGINKWAGYYYGGAARNWSLAQIDASSGNEDIRRAPYGRGMLYFAQLNAQLLAKSNQRIQLLDVLAPLFEARAAGAVLDEAAWEAMLARELGAWAVEEFRDAVLEGRRTIIPPSDAFGPCLSRVKISVQQQGSANAVDAYEWRPGKCASGA